MPSFQFDYAESRVLASMFDQTMKQLEKQNIAMQKQAVDLIEKIAYKVKTYKGKTINFSQQEHQFLKQSMTESITQIQKQMKETWFGKRWLMRSMLKQYQSLHAKLNKLPEPAKKKKKK